MNHTKNIALLSTAYMPPIQYISKFLIYDNIWIEAHEHFIKQTYRNRCLIQTANGIETLTIPVIKGSSKQIIKDIQISYDIAWQHIHWNTIVSAYNSTPFFEILRDDFQPFFEKKYKYLLDFNEDIIKTILNILELDTKIIRTKYFELIPSNSDNLREVFHPKPQKAISDKNFNPKQYSQIFNDKFPFFANMSIIDLLFNCGSASYEIVMKSIVNLSN